MNDALLVLNPRDIPESLDSIKALEIDKLWVRNHTFADIERDWGLFLDRLDGYDWMWVVSDDVVYTQAGLDAVRELAEDGHPVVTGYPNLDTSGDRRVMLTKTPLVGHVSRPESYDFYTIDEVRDFDAKTVPTFFPAYCLTGMTLAMWRLYAWTNTSEGNAADFVLGQRLEADGVPIVAAREAFCYHLKPAWLGGSTAPLRTDPPSLDLEVRSCV